jgi:OTU domain-containing protein 4
LFEPTQNLQTTNHVYVQNDAYDSENPLRVFYSHKDKHFDTIYTMEFTEKLAECQSIVYEILYTNVFKLPDVQYAVERMLHDQDEQLTLPLPDDPTKYKTQGGEIVDFDLHDETNCVLKDPRTCHFHNQVNFYEVFDENKDAITVINRTDETGGLKIYKLTDGFLHDKEKSCVRQLLEEKITPFPYKVAKALDPSIYRNTEFELWSENRKEQRLKWLDSVSSLRVPKIKFLI